MTIAEPILYILGGLCWGLSVAGFSRHHLLGWAMLIGGAIFVIFGATHTTLTVPKPVIDIPHPTVSISK